MTDRTCLAVVLAAGEGTRMRSRRPKVLHAVAGRPMIVHVLAAVETAGATDVAVVIGPDHAEVATAALKAGGSPEIFTQTERRGTAHAVLAARSALARGLDDLVVLFGDTPLIRPETIRRLRAPLADGAAVAVLGFPAADPTGYGRLILNGSDLIAIREHKDASAVEREITLCNAGVIAIDGARALELLDSVGDDNSQREFYLPDVVGLAVGRELRAVAIETDEDEVRGINTRAQLAEAEAVAQQRLRERALETGVTMISPETVYLSADTTFGRDVLVEPHVVFGPGVIVSDDVVIRSFSHIEGAQLGAGAQIGPFARLRPGTRLGEKVRIGNFVETKAADIDRGAKVNHLTYIGDASIGAESNIGAGTITCNYDGFSKYRTEIGARAFVGSNTALVAPVNVGDGAYIGSGSVITENVPADALAIGRSRQVNKEGRAERLRSLANLKKTGEHQR